MKKEYERPDVQTVPLSMETVICQSNATLQQLVIIDAFSGDDLG